MLNSAAVASVNYSKCTIISGPSPGLCPMRLGTSLDALNEKFGSWQKKVDDRVVCCEAPRTEITAGQLIITTF